jgi:hypothetical protein
MLCLFVQTQTGFAQAPTNTAPKDDLKKKFSKLVEVYNAQSKVFAEKRDAYFKVSEEKSSDKSALCKALVELDTAMADISKSVDALDEMDKSGDLAKAGSAAEVASIRDAIKNWRRVETLRPNQIAVGECRANPTGKEATLEDVVEASKNETRARLIEILKTLGNMPDYFAAAKKFKALTTSSTPAEVCSVSTEFKKASDAIEPQLDKFAKLYVLEVPPEYQDPDHPARTVEFPNQEITARAEKTLEFREQIVLPMKEKVKNIISKYGCK